MNICFLTNLKGFGGLEIQTILRAKDALDRGYNPVVIVQRNSRSENFAQSLGLPIEYINGTSVFKSLLLGNLFEKHKSDLCIVPKTNLLPLSLLGRRFSKRKPKIVFYQQMQSGINKKDPYHNQIYKNIDGAIVLTTIMEKMLIETTTIEDKKVFVVPYGVKWNLFQNEKANKIENRKRFNIPEDKFVIGCVGRIEPLKGQDILLEAFAKANLPDSVLVFAGTVDNANFYSKLIEMAVKYKIANNVLFHQFTFDVPKLMSALDVFVMPSHSETFGLVLLEAMASSLPVVATNSGGVPEIVEPNKNGLLFEPKDSEQLSQLLLLIHNRKDFAKYLGENALEKVKIKFDYEKNVNKFFEVCELILSNK